MSPLNVSVKYLKKEVTQVKQANLILAICSMQYVGAEYADT